MVATSRKASLAQVTLTTTLLLLSFKLGAAAGNSRLNVATQEVLGILRNPEKYDNGIMASNATGPVNTEFQFNIEHVDVDDMKMQINVDLTVRIAWYDPRLKFTSPGVQYVTITEPELVWLPAMFFWHAIDTQPQKTVFPDNFLRVYRDGRIFFRKRLVVLLRCEMDYYYFPHDTQFCSIFLASNGQTREEVVFRFSDISPVRTMGALYSNNFIVDGFLPNKCVEARNTGTYDCVKVSLRLTRLVNRYIMEWYIPCIFMVVVAGTSEAVASTEFLSRLLLTLLPLITLSLHASMYTLHTTPSAPYVTALDIFSGVSFLVIFVQLIRIMILHYFAQRKIKEERGDLPSRQPREDFLETIIVHADLIAKITLLVFYLLFLLTYFVVYSL